MTSGNYYNKIVSGSIVSFNNKEYIVCDIYLSSLQCTLMDRITGVIDTKLYDMEQLTIIEN